MNSKILLIVSIVIAVALVSGYMGMFGTTGKIVASGTATLYGRLVDKAAGLPIQGEPVTAGGLSAVTDSEGNYEITGIEPGKHTVVWGGDEYREIQSIELVSDGQAMERNIKLSNKK